MKLLKRWVLHARYFLSNQLFRFGLRIAVAEPGVIDERPTFYVLCPDCGMELPIPLNGRIDYHEDHSLNFQIQPEFDALVVHTWAHEQGVQTSA